jgi:exodeoxyribonuclease VII small subunit
MNFETTLSELETIIEKMESGQLSLEESLKYFEDGIKLSRVCQTALREAEQKVQLLIDHNGELRAEPFIIESDI